MKSTDFSIRLIFKFKQHENTNIANFVYYGKTAAYKDRTSPQKADVICKEIASQLQYPCITYQIWILKIIEAVGCTCNLSLHHCTT